MWDVFPGKGKAQMIYRLTKTSSSAGCKGYLDAVDSAAAEHPVPTVDDAAKAAERPQAKPNHRAPDGCGETSSTAIDLRERRLGQVRALLTGQRVNTEVRSIVAGASPGVIWVDHEAAASTALLYSFGQGGFYIVGAEQPGWVVPALSEAIKDLPQGEVTYIEVSSHSDHWDRRLRMELAEYGVEESVQFVYRRAPKHVDLSGKDTPQTEHAQHTEQPQQPPQMSKPPHTPQPSQTTSQLQFGRHAQILDPSQADRSSSESGGDPICRITPQWLEEAAEDTEWLQATLTTWWGTLDRFFEYGAGYAAVVNGQAVSCCYTSFAANDQLWALGVDTQDAHRRRGWARKVTEAMVRLCDDEGITMDWDCMATNVPSQRLAENCGFSRAFTYALFYLESVPESWHCQGGFAGRDYAE